MLVKRAFSMRTAVQFFPRLPSRDLLAHMHVKEQRENTKKGMVVFMSTHTLAMAEEMADRIGVMVKGHLQFLGTVAELRDQIANETSNLEQLYLSLTSSASTS